MVALNNRGAGPEQVPEPSDVSELQDVVAWLAYGFQNGLIQDIIAQTKEQVETQLRKEGRLL
jgi:hypothetical protein